MVKFKSLKKGTDYIEESANVNNHYGSGVAGM